MKKHFYNALIEYKNLDRSSFHTPGHKGKFLSEFDLFSLDFTELPFTDSLYEASGVIKKSEESVSKLYGSEASFISSGGNTLCIQAMIRLMAKSGDKILCDRVVHRSVVSAMALLGIEPIWLKRTICEDAGLAGEIDLEDLKLKLSQHFDIKAVYLTSPSYHGVLQDVDQISLICKNYGIPVIVDNAHGSHLKFLGLHPLDLGASMTADSAHKTLPVLTGGAWLHVKDAKFKEHAKAAMSLFGSTSPSYPVMASLDICRQWLEENGEREFLLLKEQVTLVKEIASARGIFIPSELLLSDPTRIVLGVHKIGYTGFEFREKLYEFKIEPEFCDDSYVVLIPSPFNDDKDWLRLITALQSIETRKGKIKSENFEKSMSLPKIRASLFSALIADSKKVNTKDSLGETASEIICPCPPGVPVVMPGEEIGTYEKERLINYGIEEINVIKY